MGQFSVKISMSPGSLPGETQHTSDIYALFDPANLGLALAVTEQIIDEIEELVPGAFTGVTPG